jgi:hypothetical protein
MNNSRITYIYGLYEVGKEDEIRYIGKSDNPKTRICSHISVSKKSKSKPTHKECWIRKVIDSKGEIGCKILEEVTYENWSDRERYWISKTENLTNTSPGGETGITGKLFEISYNDYKTWINNNYPNLKSIKDFREVNKYFPDFIPKSPNTVFKNYGWTSWQELLNTDFVTSKQKNKKYLSYMDCKKWINDNYPSISSWNRVKENLPCFIPKRPYIVYKNSGWTNWFDFIGVDLSPKENYLDFTEARNYVRDLKLSCSKEWFNHYKLNHKKSEFPNIPKNANSFYRKSGWINWTDFLGSSVKPTDINRNKLSYDELVKYVSNNLSHVKNKRQWIEYIKNNISVQIPKHPDIVYVNEWVSWNSFLNKKEYKRNKQFYTFIECKEIIKRNNIKSNKQWREWVKGVEGIPKNPESYFKDEWIDWYDWLGKQKSVN